MFSGWVSGSGDSQWYLNLVKPDFNPPSWIFGPVWIILYIMMGISLGIIWENRKKKSLLLKLFVLQLLLNVVWSPLFFLFQRIDFALYDIILLWLTLIILLFYSRQLISVVLLLIPYALWVSFALILNFSIYILNK